MITVEDIIVDIILNHTREGVTPIELKMINAELNYDDTNYLGDDSWKKITNRVIKKSGYVLQFLPRTEGQHFVDYINLINPNEEEAYHVEPGTKPSKYFKPITDPNDPEARAFMFLLMKEYYLMKKRSAKKMIGRWQFKSKI